MNRCWTATRRILVAVLLVAGAGPVAAHNNTIVHRGMGEWSATILGDPFYTPYIWEVGNGSDKEDVPPTRSLGHFYNPQTDSAPWFALGAGPGTQNSQDQYDEAVNQYVANILIGEDAAFHRMGRALHFIQDMTSPAHTHDDQHATDDEDFEGWGPDEFPDMDFSTVVPKFAADRTAVGFVRELGQLVYDWTAYQCDIDEDTGAQPNSEYKQMFPSLHWEDGGLFGDDVWEVDNVGTFDCFGNGVLCNDGWWMIEETLTEDSTGRGGSRRLRGFAYVENTGGNASEPVPLIFNGMANSANETMLQLYGRFFYPEAIAYGAGLLKVFRDEVDPPTPTRTQTSTVSRTTTRTSTMTPSRTSTSTATRSSTPTSTGTLAPTLSPSRTATSSVTRTQTATQSRTVTLTPTLTPTPTPSFSPTRTASPSATETITATWAPTDSPTITGTPTRTATPGPPTNSPTRTPVPDTLTPTGTPVGLCASIPQSVCKGGARTAVKFQAGATLIRNRFLWKMSNVDATTMADLGDPTMTTNYALCIYGSQAGVPQLVAASNLPAASPCGSTWCWSRVGDRGYRYKNSDALIDGIQKMILKSGTEGKAKIIVKGRGDRFLVSPQPIPQEPSVEVQLVNDNGQCWSALYGAPAEMNDFRGFRDHGP